MEYQPLIIRAQPQIFSHSPESRHWRQFKHPVFVKEYAPITSVHFSPSKPHRYAVTAATRVQIYAPRTQKITKTISRFKDVARSGHIRGDGKLVVAGDDTGLVQVFDINSRAILRNLDSHKQPVHVTKFSDILPTQILSCSDDTTVKIWDVPSQTAIKTFVDHTDYVRAGQISSSNPHIVLTGSYDSSVRLYDSRSGNCEMIMGKGLPEHSASALPVEQVLMYPSGTIAVSSAGPILRIWDVVAGGRCIRALSNHQKTVTALAFNGSASRLLTGSLDHMVKVYDGSTYKVIHTMRYPAPILCLAVSPDDTHIVGGMSDGTLAIRRRQTKPSEAAAIDIPTSGALDELVGSNLFSVKPRFTLKQVQTHFLGDTNELRIESTRAKRLKEYDKLLKAFKYSAALDSVLRKQIPPTTTFSLIQELVYRDGLKIALSGRDDVLLEPVLRLLLKYVTDPRFGELVCHVAGIVIELYRPVIGQSPLVDTLFLRLRRKVVAELHFQKELIKAKGALNMVISSITPLAPL